MSFAVYVKTKYIHNKVDHHISQQSHVKEARDFLMKNYKWPTITIHYIDWEIQRNIIKKLLHALQRTSLRFVHHRLLTGKMQFDIKHRYPYWNQSPTAETPHDDFLQCPQSGQRKKLRLKNYHNSYHHITLLHHKKRHHQQCLKILQQNHSEWLSTNAYEQ